MPHRTQYAPRCDGSADPDLWHRADVQSKRAAKRACDRCELKDACLELGMAPPDEDMWGTWGGVDAGGRRAMRAADPERWPVRTLEPADYLGTRVDRFGAERFVPDAYQADEDGVYRNDAGHVVVPYGQYDGPVRPPVDWAADAYLANAEALMDRYPTDTQTGYGLTTAGEMVYPVNDIEFAA